MTGPVVAVVGPTAVGKSAVADALAERWGSAVISADAMQVYRGMGMARAKMPVKERHAPLLLVDIIEPEESYSAALFQRDARQEIDRLQAEVYFQNILQYQLEVIHARHGLGQQ